MACECGEYGAWCMSVGSIAYMAYECVVCGVWCMVYGVCCKV
jgi:hypothetical protein